MPYVVARTINGITINGLDFLLDDETAEPRVFRTKQEARDYLADFGHLPRPIRIQKYNIHILRATEVSND